MMDIPAEFNAARFFVDRHVEEGRGEQGRVLPRGHARSPSGDLQELVNRAGNALLDLGVQREQRVLCLLLDSPEFLATFWGAIKIGAVPIPDQHHDARRQDYLYFLDDSRAPVAVISEPLLAEAGPCSRRRNTCKHVVVAGRPGAGQIGFDALDRPGLRAARGGRDLEGRRRRSGSTPRARPACPKGAVHLQHDMVVLRGHVRAPGAGDDGERPHGLGGQALLRLRARQQHVLPHARGRAGRALPAPAAAGGHVRADPPPPADPLLRRADALRRDAPGQGGGEALRPLLAAPLRLGRGGAARGALPALAGALRRRDPRRHRHDRDPAHLPLESAGASPARLDRPPRAGLRGRRRRRRGPAGARRERSGTCASRATRSWPTTGTSTRRPRTRSSGTGSRPATSTTRTPTATSGTAAAPTTCSRWAASGSRRSRSRTR